VRDLPAREATDVRSAEAVELFCYQVRKWIGSFAAALGGLDTRVFSAGIGDTRRSSGEREDIRVASWRDQRTYPEGIEKSRRDVPNADYLVRNFCDTHAIGWLSSGMHL
jgi:acetate kinase